jgi:hypothetical protein
MAGAIVDFVSTTPWLSAAQPRCFGGDQPDVSHATSVSHRSKISPPFRRQSSVKFHRPRRSPDVARPPSRAGSARRRLHRNGTIMNSRSHLSSQAFILIAPIDSRENWWQPSPFTGGLVRNRRPCLFKQKIDEQL